ncbi:ankyrin repeat-containing domain protein [Cercophora scortea]|uniref:Ankyrin repeat-containing domain protein n=1 Tax=Cercophora scortea TaxID=314031 RepID=A0AAE0IG54_9PEZI|nr:ankyrin repeat-containing domain protein [Cercophora scortea]
MAHWQPNPDQPPIILPVSVAGTVQRDTNVRQQVVIQVTGIADTSRPCYPQRNMIAALFSDWVPYVVHNPGQMVINKTASPHILVDAAKHMLSEVQDLKDDGCSLAFVAHDIGGSIVKMAMVIASKDPFYYDIFRDTHVLVFFETPHRSSKEDSWVSILEDVVESHYCRSKGPWLAERLKMLAREHEELAPRFASMSNKFNIMSYYHTAEPADPRPVLSKDCATLGLNNEERVAIGIYRHYGLLEEYEVRYLNDMLRESQIMSSPDTSAFLNMLCLEMEGYSPSGFAKVSHVNVARQLLSMPELERWANPNHRCGQVLRLRLNNRFHPGRMFESLREAIRTTDKHYHPSTIILGPPADKANSDSSSVIEIKLVDPLEVSRDIAVLPHDFPNLVVEKTEIPIRVAASFDNATFDERSVITTRFVDVDMTSGLFGQARRQDLALEVDDNCPLNKDAPEAQVAKQTAINILATSTDYRHADRFLKRLNHFLKGPLDWIRRLWHKCGHIASSFILIKRNIERHGPWIANVLFWISRSARPLSVEELRLIIMELAESGRQGSESFKLLAQYRSLAKVGDLEMLLPGVVEIRNGKAQLCQLSTQMDSFLWRAMRFLFPGTGNKDPDLYLAEKCLLFLLDFYSKGYPSTGEALVLRSDVDRKARASFAVYAARHWMTHYRAAGSQAALAHGAVFSRFLREDIVKAWMPHLAASSPGLPGRDGPPYSDKEDVNRTLRVLNLRSRDPASAFRVLELCYHASIRPSTTALLDRFIVHAAELGDGDLVCELIGKVTGRDAILRAIASAPWSLGHDLIKQCNFPVGSLTMGQVYLAALQMGNQETATKALEMLRNPPLGLLLEDVLTDATMIACQYGDESTVRAIFDDGELSSLLAKETAQQSDPVWKPLHAAVCSGNTEVVSMLLNFGMNINAETPNGDAPLMLAAEHGFHEIVSLLLQPGRGADVTACANVLGRTPLHAASQCGFLDTTRLLLGSGADKMAEDEGDIPLYLAIVRGNSDVAELLISSVPVHVSRNGLLVPPSTPVSVHSVEDANIPPPDAGDEESGKEEEFLEHLSDRSGSSSPTLSTTSSNGSDSDAFSTSTEVFHPLDVMNFRDETVLIEASKSRRTCHVAELLARERVDPTLADEHGMTALHYAAYFGLPSLIACLIEHGADIDARNSDSRTPLHIAVYCHQLEAVEELLKHHPDLLAQDNFGRSNPLTAAATVGDIRIVETLLPRYTPPKRRACFFAAVRSGWHTLTARLLDAGCCHGFDRDTAGNSAVHWAARGTNTGILQLLLSRGFPVDPEGGPSGTPLCDAARFAVVANIKVLLDAGANIEGDGVSGITPLYMAVSHRNPDATLLLLQRGARLKSGRYKINRTTSCNTILDLALRDESIEQTYTVGIYIEEAVEETIRAVLAFYSLELHRGSTQNITQDGTTPAKAISLLIAVKKFHYLPQLLDTWPGANDPATIVEALSHKESSLQNVAWKGDVDVLELILSRLPAGYDINSGSLTRHKTTPLQNAMFLNGGGDSLPKVQLLLRHGADPGVTGGILETSLNIAAHYQHLDILELLLDVIHPEVKAQFLSGAGGTRLPTEAAVLGTVHAHIHAEHEVIEILDLLLRHGASLDPRRPSGETLLHTAVRATSFDEVITWLQEHGISPDEGDITGRRPAHLAIHKGKLNTAKLLFTENTTPETVDYQGRDCFHYAVVYEMWRDSMVRDLLAWWIEDRGLDHAAVSRIVNKPDINGWTPLHWACRQPNAEVVEYLIRMGADGAAVTHTGWTPWHVAVFHGNTSEGYLGHLLAPEAGGENGELPTEPGMSHDACCSACFCKIRGTRYSCTESGCEEERVWCGPVDSSDAPSLCFKCFANHCAGLAVHYPGHVFEVVDWD